LLGVSKSSALSQQQRQAFHLAAVVASSDDAIISKDLDGIVQSWNPAAERLFGYTADEMVGQSIRRIIPEDRHGEEDEVLRRVRAGDKVDHFETVRCRKDGGLVPISLTVSPIRSDDGQIIGASKIARDLSALHAHATRLEQAVRDRTAALEAANAQLESFAYSVSHDLRAPLRGMHGLAQILLDDYGPRLDDAGRGYARSIVTEAGLLDQLIQDLLAYSRLTRVDLALENVDCGEAVEVAVHNLEHDIARAEAAIEIDPCLPTVRATRAVLTQVLTNLVSNAVKFGGERPRIRIRTERAGGRARLWIEDGGIGIDPKHHERIFRAFERLHTAERYPGTGIGLAIVRRGVERLGGRVGVESAEGAGSRFWIELQEATVA
jgi:PAS domain S-box-containing protein